MLYIFFSRLQLFFLFLEHSLHDVLKEESKATFEQEARKSYDNFEEMNVDAQDGRHKHAAGRSVYRTLAM